MRATPGTNGAHGRQERGKTTPDPADAATTDGAQSDADGDGVDGVDADAGDNDTPHPDRELWRIVIGNMGAELDAFRAGTDDAAADRAPELMESGPDVFRLRRGELEQLADGATSAERKARAKHVDTLLRAFVEHIKHARRIRSRSRGGDNRALIELTPGAAAQIAGRLETLIRGAGLPVYYRQGLGQLCFPRHEHRKRHDGRTVTVGVLRPHSVATLRRLISGIARFIRFDGRSREWVRCELPDMIINMILAGRSEQVFPSIKGLISTPILRADCSIITQPGFDADSGYCLIGMPTMPPLPDRPTRQDALDALAILEDLLSEFPFVDGISKSVAYSGLITPLVRAACPVVPGHLFTAPRQGSGKSLLVDLASAIATGDAAYAILFHEHLPQELDKQIAAAVIEGRQIISLDNLMGELSSALFGQVLERLNVSVRDFGKLINIAVVNAFCGYGTGNNIAIAGDLARRILEGRIDPKLENPLDRVFKKTHPLKRVQADQGKYVAACLTIVRAYHVAGRPTPLTPLLSYDEWSRLVREALVWLGLDDPVESMHAALAEDPTNAGLANLIAAWPTAQPECTAAELVAFAKVLPDLEAAIQAVAAARQPGGIDLDGFGKYLRSNRDKIVGAKKIVRVRLTRNKVAVWAIR
jgi:putative DNA primase/helicase